MVVAVCVIVPTWWAIANSGRSPLPVAMHTADDPETADPDAFTFARVRYESSGGYSESWYRFEGRDWQRWETDYPQAELNLLARLNELTSIRVNPRPRVIRLTDDSLFDYPLIFMSDVGWQVLSRAERLALRRYLRRGGFLWVDDFWGRAEWQCLVANTLAECPTWTWRQLPNDHPLLRTVYPLKECPQIPARSFFQARGLEYDPPWVHRQPAGGDEGVRTVHFMGLFDDTGRLVGVATHNSDIADGWEREGEDEEFFRRFSIQSYAMAINVLVYVFTR